MLKDREDYLQNKARFYKRILIITTFISLSIIFLIITMLISNSNNIFIGLNLYILFYFATPILLSITGFFITKYMNYQKGIKGENSVIAHLSTLPDSYYLINDVKIGSDRGNIDHIVLGPNGIFVIESKNYSGIIECNGDKWDRIYEDKIYEINSPSKQVKRNAMKIKKIIEHTNYREVLSNLWVNGIVVFTNPDINLKIMNPTVPVLKVEELAEYIANKKDNIVLSPKEIRELADVILYATK